MRLYLVQHGEARDERDERQRSLSEVGQAATSKMAQWAARVGLEVEQIRHSSKQRALQTAAILGQHLQPPQGVVEVASLKPKDDVAALAETVEAQSATLMLVGHLPSLARLAGLLIAGAAETPVIRFSNSGIVSLSRQDGRWALDWSVLPDHV